MNVWISWENLDTDHLKLLSIYGDNVKMDLKEIGWKASNGFIWLKISI